MRKRRDFKLMIFQQDGAKAYTANEMLDLQIFGKCVISNRYAPRFFEGWFWPPDSLDLSPLDYFLWSYVKSKCCKNDPKTVEELQKEIKRIFWEFNNTILPCVLGNFLTRLDYVIENEGSHVKHLLHWCSFFFIWLHFVHSWFFYKFFSRERFLWDTLYKKLFEPIFIKLTWLVRVHSWVNPVVFGNNRPNRATNMGENVPPKPVFRV